MASPVVVVDRPTMEENFVENGLSVFCNAAFGAGAYAIGGRLLGFPALTPPGALLTTGALLSAMAFCPSRPTQEGVFGKDPPMAGAQCPTMYEVSGFTQYYNPSNNTNQERIFWFTGPVMGPLTGPVAAKVGNELFTRITAANGVVKNMAGVFNNPGEPREVRAFEQISVVRVDGLPDNCGDQPRPGSQVIQNNTTGDTINNSNVTNNQNYFQVIPVVFNFGGISGTLNMNFGGIKINSLFPLNFDIDVGGVRFRIGEGEDGQPRLKPVNPDKELPSTDEEEATENLEKVLERIRQCVCTPEVDLDALFMPFVDESVGCEIQTSTLLVPKGSVSNSTYQKFQNSASLAKSKCEEDEIEQKEEELIFAATTTSDGRELFTPELSPEIISLRVKITAVNNNSLSFITTYPEARQRKFGSVSYVLKNIDGGGDYIYVFDQDTYIPLPRRAKEGKLRILFKAGISFEVYDTGERI